jgi:hypothetical protein
LIAASRNQSPFENDYDLHYRLFTSHGAAVDYHKHPPVDASQMDICIPGDLIRRQVAPTIYYGEWIDNRFKIEKSRPPLYRSATLVARSSFTVSFSSTFDTSQLISEQRRKKLSSLQQLELASVSNGKLKKYTSLHNKSISLKFLS